MLQKLSLLLFEVQALSFGLDESNSSWCKLQWTWITILCFETWTSYSLLPGKPASFNSILGLSSLFSSNFCWVLCEKAEAAEKTKHKSSVEEEHVAAPDLPNVADVNDLVEDKADPASAADSQVVVFIMRVISTGCMFKSNEEVFIKGCDRHKLWGFLSVTVNVQFAAKLQKNETRQECGSTPTARSCQEIYFNPNVFTEFKLAGTPEVSIHLCY